MLGPRITPQTVSRLRRLACPTSAAALLIALATDARAGRLTLCAPRRISPDLGQVGLLTGTYRIPIEKAKELLLQRGLPVRGTDAVKDVKVVKEVKK